MKQHAKDQIITTLLFCALLGGFAGCTKQDNKLTPATALSADESIPQAKAKEDVVLQNGILVFKDRATMRTYNSDLNREGIVYADAWEKSMKFESMAHILNEVNTAERKLEEDFLVGKSEDELSRLSKEPAPHTALYTKWVNAGTLRVEKEPDGGEYLGVNASHTHYTNVLNAQGLVAFGDTVYQYKGNLIKATTQGISSLPALQAATASDPKQEITVKQSPFRYEPKPAAGNRATNEISFNDYDFADAYYDNNKRKTVVTVYLFSEILGDAHKRNFVDFWIEASCRKKDFWGRWRDVANGDGMWAIEATYSWNAVVTPFSYSNPNLTLNVPGYTRGVAYVYHHFPNFPGFIKLDYTTGAPQFGNQLFPNGTYTPYFDPSLGYNYYISQGIKLDRGSVFKCIPIHHRSEAVLTWKKL